MNSGGALFLSLALLNWQGPTQAQEAAEVRGVVLDARGGEPLANVRVELLPGTLATVTDARGRFSFAGVRPGDYVLHVATVGYRLVKKNFSLIAGEVKDFEVALTPDTLRQTDSVEVRAGPFETAREDSPSTLTLRGIEAKNLASVLADDPLRAVQGLPGVTSDDDFHSRFSLRGAGDHRVGLYLDDVKLHVPFHVIQGEPASGSLTVFNGDMLDGLELHSGAFPARYADATVAAVDLRTREGSRLKPSARASASASNATFLAEGPLGKNRRGAWLASVRQSYLHYLIRRVTDVPSLAFGFFDAQAKLNYDFGRKNSVSLSLVDGSSGLDRRRDRAQLGLNTLMTSDYDFTLANLAWRFTPHERFVLTARGAFLRERFRNQNREDLKLGSGQYGEWAWISSATWAWRGPNALDFGFAVRRLRDDGYFNRYQFNPLATLRLDEFRGTGVRLGGFAEQSFRADEGRLVLALGARWDRHSAGGIEAVSPQASLAWRARPTTRLTLGWGQYVQFPELSQSFSILGSPGLLPERANHFVLALEERFDERTRLRVEFYERDDRDVLFRPLLEPRILGDQIFNPPLDAPYRNSLRGYARGFEIFLQRRSANRLTGWISYALGTSRLEDGETGAIFPSDNDQRHTVNIYLSYRLRPTVNLSVKSLYGSGFPIPGFYRREGDRYFLSLARNALRLDAYERTDFRINKAYVFDRWKLTLYGEVVNILNRRNFRYETFNGYNPATRQAYFTLDKMMPTLPSAGVVLEF